MKGTGGAQEWKIIEELDAVDNLIHEDDVKMKEAQKQMAHKLALEEQLGKQRELKERRQKADHDWGREVWEDAQKYRAEEEQKKNDRMDMQRRFNEERARQLQDIRQRKKAEKDEDDRIEKNLIQGAIDAKRQEEERDAERKHKQAQDALRIANEAKEAMVRKQEQMAEERKSDIRMMQKQKEMLDKQEADRANYFEQMKEKSRKLQQAYEAGAGNEMAQRQAEDEARARLHQEKEAERAKKADEDRENRRQRMREEGFNAVQQQLQVQAQERERLHAQDKQFGQQFRMDAQAAIAAEQEEKRQRRLREQENQEYLKKQMAEKSKIIPGKFGHQKMNAVEKSINRQKMARVQNPERPDGLQLLFRQKQLQYQSAA